MSALEDMTADQVAGWVEKAGAVLIQKDAEAASALFDRLSGLSTAAVGSIVMDQKVAQAHENQERIATILRGVGARHVVAVPAIKSSSRKDHIVSARAHAAWLLRHRLGMSYPAIGFHLGHRHHTSAMHLVEKWQKRVDEGARDEQEPSRRQRARGLA